MRIAVIGAGGRMGRQRISDLLALGERDILIHDIDWERQFYVGITPDIAAYRTVPLLLSKQPDAVLICTPPATHLDLAWQAYQAGVKAIFVEKPLALTMPTAEQLAGFAECVTMVGCNLRWVPGIAGLEAGLPLGENQTGLSVAFYTAYHLPSVRPDYRESYAATTGALFDVGWHLVDLALDWLGPAHLHYSSLGSARAIDLPDTDGHAGLILRHHNGAESLVSVSFVADHYEMAVMVTGPAGCEDWKRTAPPGPEMFRLEMQHFIECAREGRQTCNPMGSAVAVLRLLLEARERWH